MKRVSSVCCVCAITKAQEGQSQDGTHVVMMMFSAKRSSRAQSAKGQMTRPDLRASLMMAGETCEKKAIPRAQDPFAPFASEAVTSYPRVGEGKRGKLR